MNTQHSTFNVEPRTEPSSVARRKSAVRWMLDVPPSRAQQGVALVVTLIMLSIITFLTVAFLALSRRDKSSVSTSTDQIQARTMAEAALARAVADMNAGIIASGSLENYGARVMTNYSNPAGFVPNRGPGNLNNVNFDVVLGFPIGYLNMLPAHRAELLGNLLYDPRVPVLVTTNFIQGRPQYDFRFYLDLNRNGRFDPSLPGQIGDPEWCGALERSGLPHGGNNSFMGRYSYLVQPIGQTLDFNAIHNEARTRTLTQQGDGYWRNQNVGTWEINFAAFLADLNFNFWGTPLPGVGTPYAYNPFSVPPVVNGSGFEDAVQFLAYRYNGGYTLDRLTNFAGLYPIRPGEVVAPAQIFSTDYIDGYSSGPLWTSLSGLAGDPDFGRALQPWVGAENPRAFFSIQDVFDPAKVGQNFVNRLQLAGADTNNAYNAYTYYRMIQQIGTSSAPEQNKINLNYDNRVRGITNSPFVYIAPTNFLPWRPLDFFTNAAARLLAELNLDDTNGNPISITNIPIYPNNYYTPAVHQALQLAANIYDATTNRWAGAYPHMPSVFRPRFGRTGTNIFIAGYLEVTDSKFLTDLTSPTLDLQIPADRTSPLLDINNTNANTIPNIHGVPLVIGAKKGLPNFNEFSLQNIIDVSRRLQLSRPRPGSPVNLTNQQYLISIRHHVGIELWNSYTSTYSKPVTLIVRPMRLTLSLTNEIGEVLSTKVVDLPGVTEQLAANTWSGYLGSATDASFKVPLSANHAFVDKQSIKSGTPASLVASNYFEPGFPMPKLFLTASANVQCLIADSATGNVIDYVTLAGLGSTVDIMSAAVGNYDLEGSTSFPGSMWISNRVAGTALDSDPPMGVINQLEVSKGNTPSSDNDWRSYSENPIAGSDRYKAIDRFRVFLGERAVFQSQYPNEALNPIQGNTAQAPYTPTRKLKQDLSWQANDPLVHYMAADLNDPERAGLVELVSPPNNTTQFTNNLNRLNRRYQPWAGNPLLTPSATAYSLALKDPLIKRSDNWSFPTNKFPNAGWLGRVHRGTPWQTIFLKSAEVDLRTWTNWTGNDVIIRDGNNARVDGNFTLPIRDRRLFDIFTAAVNDNATLGQLSVNQTNAASWSAVLSGVVVLSNSAPDSALLSVNPQTQFAPQVIAPAARDTNALPKIVRGIIRTRNSQEDREFNRLGDILAVPEMTVNSPFINRTNSVTVAGGVTAQEAYGIPDTVYERIPEQIMGLLRAGAPRYVVYAYGQALKQAPNSLFAFGGSQICTNYQVTAEVALRAVVRVEGSSSQPRVVIESYNLMPPD